MVSRIGLPGSLCRAAQFVHLKDAGRVSSETNSSRASVTFKLQAITYSSELALTTAIWYSVTAGIAPPADTTTDRSLLVHKPYITQKRLPETMDPKLYSIFAQSKTTSLYARKRPAAAPPSLQKPPRHRLALVRSSGLNKPWTGLPSSSMILLLHLLHVSRSSHTLHMCRLGHHFTHRTLL